MRVTIAGFLTDQTGRALLQRLGARALRPVSRSLGPGESPAETLARAFRESTGLYVLPVRLVGLYLSGGNTLTLAFRCALRGGELPPPAGQPPAGFFDPQPRPRGLSAVHRRQLDDALHHAGGPAVMARLGGGLGARWRGERRVDTAEAVDWAATTRLVAYDSRGQVVWTRSDPAGPWRLPAAGVGVGQAPWATAEQLQQTLRLDQNGHRPIPRLITLAAARPMLTVVFVAALVEPLSPRAPGESVSFASPDGAQQGFDAADRALAAEVLAGPEATLVRLET